MSKTTHGGPSQTEPLEGAAARKLIDALNAVASKWAGFRFGPMTVEPKDDRHFIATAVFMKDTNPNVVQVEIYADAANGGSPVHQAVTQLHPLPREADGVAISATVSSPRPANDFTARIQAKGDGLSVPFMAEWILWQKMNPEPSYSCSNNAENRI